MKIIDKYLFKSFARLYLIFSDLSYRYFWLLNFLKNGVGFSAKNRHSGMLCRILSYEFPTSLCSPPRWLFFLQDSS